MFSNKKIITFTKDCLDKMQQLKTYLKKADAVIIGAGAGLSTAAGFTYAGERFHRYFQDFIDKYGFKDMYSGGFYSFESPEEYWAYWSRYIAINRYADAENDTYKNLYSLVKDKDYFVITTNVDHQFQKAGFDKERLFYTQGDYGLFQCMVPCHHSTYDNEQTIRQMMEAQGYLFLENGVPYALEGTILKTKVPKELIPQCPVCHKPMTMNLRADDTFVEDDGWHKAAVRYRDFLEEHRKVRTLFLELGVGYNTPGIIKYPFWQMTHQWLNAAYVCINYGQVYAPHEIQGKSICIDADIKEILAML